MPDYLLGISIPRSSRKSTVPCPLSHCSQLPHPRVRGRSPLGSESCPVPPTPHPRSGQPELVRREASTLLHPPGTGAPWMAGRTVWDSRSWHFPAHPGGPLFCHPAHPLRYLRARAWESKGNQSSASPSKEERTLTSGTILLPQGQALRR